MNENNKVAARGHGQSAGGSKAALRKVALIIVAAVVLVCALQQERRNDAARKQVSRESVEASSGEDILGGRPGSVIEVTAGSMRRQVILPVEDVKVMGAVRDQVRGEFEQSTKTVASNPDQRGE